MQVRAKTSLDVTNMHNMQNNMHNMHNHDAIMISLSQYVKYALPTVTGTSSLLTRMGPGMQDARASAMMQWLGVV